MNKKKILTLVFAFSLIALVGVGGTLAYFTDEEETSSEVTMSKVDVKLTETLSNGDVVEVTENGLTFKNVMPGQTLKKNPTVTLSDDSTDCYVRIKMDIVASENNTNDISSELKMLEEGIIASVTEAEDSLWYYEDGYFYYQGYLSNAEGGVKEVTLFETIKIPVKWGNKTAGQSFYVIMKAEAVQYEYFEIGPNYTWGDYVVE